jgi:hypothetical protein
MSRSSSGRRSRYETVLLVAVFAPLSAVLSSGPSLGQTVTGGEATAVELPQASPPAFAGDVRGLPHAAVPLRREAHAVAGYIPVRGAVNPSVATTNLTYHNGPVIGSAKVVFIFWGPSFANVSSPDHLYAQTLQSFRNQYGTTPEYNVITEYSGIQRTNLGSGTPDVFDTSTPPTNVTDAIVQAEVNAYLASHAFDASTIYEVVTPSGSYSSDGSPTSCGGPDLQYCAYHGSFTSGSNTVKYSIQPYPSCSGCSLPGWSDVQNQEHFVTHETREAVTDAMGNAWWDDNDGSEADDKCAWSPTPFIGTGGYSYQYEWSNAISACVQTAPISPTSGSFYSVAPCRLLDTRNSSPLTAGVTYELAAAGLCGIATTATSVSVNVTDVNATHNGFMTFWPAQSTIPGTSTLNFTAGRVRANNAIFVLAPGFFGSPGAIWFAYSAGSGTSDVLVDVNGYFK